MTSFLVGCGIGLVVVAVFAVGVFAGIALEANARLRGPAKPPAGVPKIFAPERELVSLVFVDAHGFESVATVRHRGGRATQWRGAMQEWRHARTGERAVDALEAWLLAEWEKARWGAKYGKVES